ncbi:MAG: Re/Si-specific NAD(P)(+) transhydrogenase subunit alpha [Phycisphaerales bacterium]
MHIAVPREIWPGENRVAATPSTVQRLIKLGFSVVIESGAGDAANFSDAGYAEAGATIEHDAAALWKAGDIVLKVRPPDASQALGMYEADLLREGATVISFLAPAQSGPLLALLASRKVTLLSMDCVPRMTRAQKMDALSAMANLAGYRAVIEAASALPRLFGGQITAAGRVDPARVLVIGAGVAGLSAIGLARAMGAIVRAFDTRPEVKEQVQSMGAEFLELDFDEEGAGEGGYARVMSDAFIEAEMALFAEQAMEVDVIITTALIPGKEAPRLITAGMVEAMHEGSVIVDLASEQGGNCALTQPGTSTTHAGVTIIGYTDLPSRMASQASELYGTTLVHMLEEMGGNEHFNIDADNEVIRGALILNQGVLSWPPPRREPPEQPVVHERRDSVDLPARSLEPLPKGRVAGSPRRFWQLGVAMGAILLLLIVGLFAPASFIGHLTVFVLACFIGWGVIWNVTPALHTPLMSMTNAISGIIVIGGLLQVSSPRVATVILGAVAVFVATINISGGLLVTKRMLRMFQR